MVFNSIVHTLQELTPDLLLSRPCLFNHVPPLSCRYFGRQQFTSSPIHYNCLWRSSCSSCTFCRRCNFSLPFLDDRTVGSQQPSSRSFGNRSTSSQPLWTEEREETMKGNFCEGKVEDEKSESPQKSKKIIELNF